MRTSFCLCGLRLIYSCVFLDAHSTSAVYFEVKNPVMNEHVCGVTAAAAQGRSTADFEGRVVHEHVFQKTCIYSRLLYPQELSKCGHYSSVGAASSFVSRLLNHNIAARASQTSKSHHGHFEKYDGPSRCCCCSRWLRPSSRAEPPRRCKRYVAFSRAVGLSDTLTTFRC